VVNPNHNYPIRRFLTGNETTIGVCTASVINTANGNIGLTAEHCLIDRDGKQYNLSFLSFSPGYDNETNGPLGAIPVEDVAIPYTHLVDPRENDYALVRFAFKDPNRGGARLQDYTGALGWRFDIGNNELTCVFCYPVGGNLENCIRDSKHLCKWQGITKKRQNFYVIRNVDLGYAASGSPYISQYDTETNLGYAYTLMTRYINTSEVSVGKIWDENVFFGLLLRLTS
ncbi:29047_t:CDS:1, partial [Gigaspora margarita]